MRTTLSDAVYFEKTTPSSSARLPGRRGTIAAHERLDMEEAAAYVQEVKNPHRGPVVAETCPYF
jgi:hypothetical protein